MSYGIPQTPQRPLPGAYLSTPSNIQSQQVQTRQPKYSAPTAPISQQYGSQQGQALAQQHQQQGQFGKQQMEDLKPVERASRTINDALIRETQYPELDSYVSRKPAQPKSEPMLILDQRACRRIMTYLRNSPGHLSRGRRCMTYRKKSSISTTALRCRRRWVCSQI